MTNHWRPAFRSRDLSRAPTLDRRGVLGAAGFIDVGIKLCRPSATVWFTAMRRDDRAPMLQALSDYLVDRGRTIGDPGS